MKNLNSLYILVFFFGIFILSSCNKDEPVIEDPEEVITTLELTLTEVNSSEVVTFTFKDIDGDGGNAPEITTGNLTAGATYTGAVTFWNESVTPAENVTEEVAEEAEEHQVFYLSDSTLSFDYDDADEDQNPIGLQTSVRTSTTPATGSLTVVLRHEPNKSANGVADGDITNAGGETDIEVTFPITIE